MYARIMSSDGVECRTFKHEQKDGRGLGTKATKCASESHCACYTRARQHANVTHPTVLAYYPQQQQALEKEKKISANKVIYVPVC